MTPQARKIRDARLARVPTAIQQLALDDEIVCAHLHIYLNGSRGLEETGREMYAHLGRIYSEIGDRMRGYGYPFDDGLFPAWHNGEHAADVLTDSQVLRIALACSAVRIAREWLSRAAALHDKPVIALRPDGSITVNP